MGRMNAVVFYAGAVWQAAKFFFLFHLASLALNPEREQILNLLLLWAASAQLCVALLFFLGGYLPEKFGCLRKVTAVFMFVGCVPPFLFLLNELPPLVFRLSGFMLPRIFSPQTGFDFTAPACIITVIDVFFLVFLLGFSPDRGGRKNIQDAHVNAVKTDTLKSDTGE